MNSFVLFFKNLIPKKWKQAFKDSVLYRFVKKRVYNSGINQWISLKKAGSRKPFFRQKMGVNLIGFLEADLGLGSAARGVELALRTAEIPVNLINIDLQNTGERTGGGLHSPLGSSGPEYGINLIHINPPEYLFLWNRVEKDLLAGGYNIGVWYWELPELPHEWRKSFGVLDEIWVASRFVQEAVQKESPIPVHKIPPCVPVELDQSLKRSDFNLPAETFLFLNAYDTHSVSERKNPLAAIRAFMEAFQENDTSVGLVIKVRNADDDPDTINQIKQRIQGHLNCYLIEDTFPKVKFNSLVNLVDAFVSLHRSEGFGLIPAEAMCLGKPVIATNWSGNTDFMTPENSCLVDYQPIPVKPGLLHYHPGHFWADADVSQAARLMKSLASDHGHYNKISENARITIVRDFSTQRIGDIMRKKLEGIIG